MNPIPKRLKLPVHMVYGRWEFFYSGEVPVAEGTQAEMVMESARNTDKDFLHRVTQRVVSHSLPRGTQLMVARSIHAPTSHAVFYNPNSQRAKSIKVDSWHLRSVSTQFVPVNSTEI